MPFGLASIYNEPYLNLNIVQKVAAPEVKRIIFNNPATIVFWTDGTKTVVKCCEGEKFSEYYGFLAALGKKVYGSNSTVQRIVKKHMTEKETYFDRLVRKLEEQKE